VIEDAAKINVTLVDGRKFTARVVGVDPRADLAVLQIPADHLTAMGFGDSDRLRVGDFVVAIGNPYGIGQTVTSGIISAMHRNPGISEYENFIQTDAPINLGNSGGPLVNLHGDLVGINTAILGDQGGGSLGIGFAVPINTAASVINQIIRFGHVERGQLGIEVGDIDQEMIRSLGLKSRVGAVVAEVIPGSAAERAGIQPNDVIIRLNGLPVGNAKDVKNKIGNLAVGAKVKVDLAHEGKVRSVTAIIGEAGATAPKNPHQASSQSGGEKPSWERNF
jgi:S1-C subfamily serine protease